MASSDRIELDGVVTNANRSIFTVSVNIGESSTRDIICRTSGRLKINNIRVLVGDKVKITVSPYDLTKGTITYRFK